jgi:hypothetical protein
MRHALDLDLLQNFSTVLCKRWQLYVIANCTAHDHPARGQILMKRPNFASVNKTLLIFGVVLFVLTNSLTTATMQTLNEGFEAGGKTSYAAANVEARLISHVTFLV